MRSHQHQFVEIEKVTRSGWDNKIDNPNVLIGVKVACAICGEVREVLENGRVDILIIGRNDNPDKPKTAHR